MRHWLARVWSAVLARVPQEWQVERMGKWLRVLRVEEEGLEGM